MTERTSPTMDAGLRRKRTIVTGGAGFLGSHLCDRLLAKDHEVICVDNFYTGSKQNIQHLLHEPYFELIHHAILGRPGHAGSFDEWVETRARLNWLRANPVGPA